ncbi:MAG TPA: GAF domain-containing protein [Thermoleophilaceae bacterium]|nr:GAF domain-containing protein [Thermoleophilaceae bacterium]
MRAVTRLLSAAADLQGPDVVRHRLVAEARDFFGVARAVLLEIHESEGRAEPVVANPTIGVTRRPLAIAELPPLELLLRQGLPALLAQRDEAHEIDRLLGSDGSAGTALLLPMRAGSAVRNVLLLLDDEGRAFSEVEIGVAGSFAAAAAASLAQMRLAEEHAAQVAQQAALARAAKTLNESLDLNRVLAHICSEAASILDGDNAAIFRGDASGITIEAVHGIVPEAIGYRLAPGVGLSGRVAELDKPLITNDYQALLPKPDADFFGDVRSCVAVPMHWDGKLRGVLAVGFHRRRELTREDMNLLEAFGELAAAACRNASAHAGLAQVARTDGLTGCLNHTAMQHMLRREIERGERTGHRLSLILIDLDDFKQVNEEHGHLVGDEVLRRVGAALRAAVRPYDLVARYGGDEFAIVAIEADERAAAELARRTLDGIDRAFEGEDGVPDGCAASAGVAEWEPDQTPAALIDNADRALLHGKQHRGRGSVVVYSDLPAGLRPLPARRPEAAQPALAPIAPVDAAWPDQGREQTERLRLRTRQLSLANAIGTRLSAMTDPEEIIDAAVDELNRAFGYFLCAIVRIREDNYVESVASRGSAQSHEESRPAMPRAAGVIGRCLRERRPVIVGDVRDEPDYVAQPKAAGVRSELAVPIWVGDDLWGAIDIEEERPDAFDDDDARLVQTVAGQVGSALRSAMLYEQLDGAYIGTAQALAAALEAGERGQGAAGPLIELATAVGRRLDMTDDAIRSLRLAAIFHDIGKVSVSQDVLNKRGPLTDSERLQVERHTVVGESILSSVEFLEDVRPLVRHAHERWDGGGYPDGLAAEAIPLGARIVHACDAYDAMTAARPYREPLSDAEARSQLVAGAGSQFDPGVVAALLAVLDADIAATA